MILESIVNESLCNLFVRFQDERENPFNQTTPLYRKWNYSATKLSLRSILVLSLNNINIVYG
jgi:hypothetical protein